MARGRSGDGDGFMCFAGKGQGGHSLHTSTDYGLGYVHYSIQSPRRTGKGKDEQEEAPPRGPARTYVQYVVSTVVTVLPCVLSRAGDRDGTRPTRAEGRPLGHHCEGVAADQSPSGSWLVGWVGSQNTYFVHGGF